MSLFSTITQSAVALQVSQLGLQVVGNNIANANTPGYIRQNLELASGAPTRLGGLVVGQGVRTTGVVQQFDHALAERMWQAGTAVEGSGVLERAYRQLEDLTGGLDGNGLNQRLTMFNDSLHELANQPASSFARDMVLQQGAAMAEAIGQLHDKALGLQRAWDEELQPAAEEINRLTARIAQLNLDIVTIEGGRVLHSDATGLRDERYQAIEELSRYISINVQEQPSGSVTIFVGGDYLVSETQAREVFTASSGDVLGSEIRIRDTDSPLQSTGGAVAATLQVRDQLFHNYLADLDTLAAGLARAVNEVHSQGQGTVGYTSLTGTVATETGVPLDRAGLDWVPDNGSFDVHVVDDAGTLVGTHRIAVRRLNMVGDSTVDSIVADIDAIEGLSASIDPDGKIRIDGETPGLGFTFGDDTSGFLAAAGVNTFYSGNSATTLEVNAALRANPRLLAVSRHGIAADTDVLAELVAVMDQPQSTLHGQSVRGVLEQSMSRLAQAASLQRSAGEGNRNYHATLQGEHLGITGVNLDEEAVRMITYQRAFQASSRVIAAASEMLELLVNL